MSNNNSLEQSHCFSQQHFKMFIEKEVLPSDPGLDWVFSEDVINLDCHLYDSLSKQGVMTE